MLIPGQPGAQAIGDAPGQAHFGAGSGLLLEGRGPGIFAVLFGRLDQGPDLDQPGLIAAICLVLDPGFAEQQPVLGFGLGEDGVHSPQHSLVGAKRFLQINSIPEPAGSLGAAAETLAPGHEAFGIGALETVD